MAATFSGLASGGISQPDDRIKPRRGPNRPSNSRDCCPISCRRAGDEGQGFQVAVQAGVGERLLGRLGIDFIVEIGNIDSQSGIKRQDSGRRPGDMQPVEERPGLLQGGRRAG